MIYKGIHIVNINDFLFFNLRKLNKIRSDVQLILKLGKAFMKYFFIFFCNVMKKVKFSNEHMLHQYNF